MNVITNNSNVQPTDRHTLFQDEPVITVEEGVCNDPSQLLKYLGVYSSTNQARKAGRVGDIPVGWSEIKASKKVELFLWNPSEQEASLRSIDEILNLESSEDLSPEERRSFEEWLDTDARYIMSSSDYCYLLGWYTLNSNIPLSPKEAGFN